MRILFCALSIFLACPFSARAGETAVNAPIAGPALTAWAGAIGKTLTAPGQNAVEQVMNHDVDSGKVLQFLVLPTAGRSIVLEEKPQYARRLAQALAAQGLTPDSFAHLEPARQIDVLKTATWTALRGTLDESSHVAYRLSPRVNPTEGEVIALSAHAKELIDYDLPFLKNEYTLQVFHYAVMRGEAIERDRRLRIEKFDKELPAKIAAGDFDYGKLALVTDGAKWGLADKSAVPTSGSPVSAVLKRSDTLAYVSVGPWSKAMHGALWRAAETEPAKSAIAREDSDIGHSLLLNARLIDAHIDYEGNRQPKVLKARKDVAAALKAGKLPSAAAIAALEKQYLAAIDGAAKHRVLRLTILDWLKNGKSADYPAWPKVLAAKQALAKRIDRARNYGWAAFFLAMFGLPMLNLITTPMAQILFLASLGAAMLIIVHLNTRHGLLQDRTFEKRMADYEKELAAASEPK